MLTFCNAGQRKTPSHSIRTQEKTGSVNGNQKESIKLGVVELPLISKSRYITLSPLLRSIMKEH